MIRLGSARGVVLVALLASQPASSQSSIEIQDQRIRVDVNLATLRFSVMNSLGEFLNTLDRSQFKIFENGTLREISFFEPPRNPTGSAEPLTLAFLIDISGSTLATRTEEIAAAQTLLANLNQFTRVGVFGFTDQLIPFQDFTTARDLAQKAFEETHRHLGQTALYGSLDSLIRRMVQASPSGTRKTIVIISDGMDEDYQKAEGSIRLADQNGVTIYTILVPSAAQLYIGPAAGQSPEESLAETARSRKEAAFSRLSVRTGGRHFSGFEAILDFDGVMAQISDDIFGNLYLLAYHTEFPDREERDIRVEISHPDARIPGQFESIQDSFPDKRAFVEALFDSRAIDKVSREFPAAYREIGAEMDVLPSRRGGGEAGIPFRIKINPYGLRGWNNDRIRTQLGVIGLLLDPNGREVLRLREIFQVALTRKEVREGRGIIYTNKLLAPAGSYSLRVALVELSSWRVTAFQRQVRVSER